MKRGVCVRVTRGDGCRGGNDRTGRFCFPCPLFHPVRNTQAYGDKTSNPLFSSRVVLSAAQTVFFGDRPKHTRTPKNQKALPPFFQMCCFSESTEAGQRWCVRESWALLFFFRVGSSSATLFFSSFVPFPLCAKNISNASRRKRSRFCFLSFFFFDLTQRVVWGGSSAQTNKKKRKKRRTTN